MIQRKLQQFAEKVIFKMAENRRRAQLHNHDYLEFWRGQHGV